MLELNYVCMQTRACLNLDKIPIFTLEKHIVGFPCNLADVDIKMKY